MHDRRPHRLADSASAVTEPAHADQLGLQSRTFAEYFANGAVLRGMGAVPSPRERASAMASAAQTHATLDDLYRVEGKAELIGGRIVPLPTGHLPGVVAGEIFVNLRLYARAAARGVAYPDGVGFAVPELPSGRESFSPDAAYHIGAAPANLMRFSKGRRSSRRRFAARTTTVTRPRIRSAEKRATTSPRGRRWSGTWTRWPKRSRSTGRTPRRSRSSTVAATRPRRSLPSRRGESPSPTCSRPDRPSGSGRLPLVPKRSL